MRILEGLPQEDSPAQTVTLYCQIGDHNWERPAIRGRRPSACPDCLAKQQPQEKKPPVSQEDLEARLHLARAKKAEKAREAALRAQEEQAQRRESIERQLPNLWLMWNRTFTIALRENTEHAWKKCENLMTAYVNAKASLVKERSTINGQR